MNHTRRLLALVAGLFAALPLAASASTAKVGVKIAELRIKPSESAFSRLKLGVGREIDVLGKSSDGAWLKVRAEVLRADEKIAFEGWLDASQVKGIDLASLSTVDGGASSGSSSGGWGAASSGNDFFGDGGSASADSSYGTSSSSSSDGWGDSSSSSSSSWGDSAPASDSPWGDTSSSPSSDSSWDSGSSSGGSDDGWGSSDTSSADSEWDTSGDNTF